MEINLVTISKQCSSIINVSPITLPIEKPSLSDLYDEIYDIYPALDTSNFNLYWRYNDETFYQIVDYLSYLTVFMLMVDKNLYLVVDDCDEHCNENEEFLKRLDHIEFKEQVERERDIYDVIIIRKGEIREDSFEDIRKQITTDPKTDAELILYALRKLLKIKYYTSDLIFKTKLIEATKRGMS